MLRSLSVLLATGATLAVAVTPADAAKRRSCPNVRYAPMYKTITKVSVTNAGCTTARRVVLAYERAITSGYSPSTGETRTGVCFGAKSFGECTIKVDGRKYLCNRPEGSGSTLPATCTRRTVTVRFRG